MSTMTHELFSAAPVCERQSREAFGATVTRGVDIDTITLIMRVIVDPLPERGRPLSHHQSRLSRFHQSVSLVLWGRGTATLIFTQSPQYGQHANCRRRILACESIASRVMHHAQVENCCRQDERPLSRQGAGHQHCVQKSSSQNEQLRELLPLNPFRAILTLCVLAKAI